MDIDGLITHYFRLGYTHLEIVATIATIHGVALSERTLQRHLRRLGLYRRKNQSNLADIVRFLQEQLQRSGQLHGYRFMHRRLLQEGFVVSRHRVRRLLLHLDPEGVALRKRRRLVRRRYCGQGPNFIWHIDSYDKLKPYGVGISGCIDGFSRKIIWLEANATTNDPEYIGGFFINAVEKHSGCPTVVRTDLGTENGHVLSFQRFLRVHGDRLSGRHSFITGKSTANQRIECWWSQLRKECTEFWMTLFRCVKDDGYFSGDQLDKELIRFIFMRMIQDDLDKMAELWDGHRIRKNKQEHVAHGRPLTMFELPQLYNTINYLKPVDQDRVNVCKEESMFKENYPCDEDLFSYACLLMEAAGRRAPNTPEEAVNLYIDLRRHIRRALA